VRDLPVVDVAGSPRERGRQYGEAAAPQIAIALDYYREAFSRWSGLQWPEVQERARSLTPSIQEFAPDLLQEVEGIAEGSGRSRDDILALNARSEVAYDRSFGNSSVDGCTAFALLGEATGDGHVYAGQNWDWYSGVLDSVVFLRVHDPSRPTIVMELEAGHVGRHGANSAGIALNVNGLGKWSGVGPSAQRKPVPQPFIRRRLLESTTMYEALSLALSKVGTIPVNLVLTHRDGFSISIECTPGGDAWVYPVNGVLVHGNHYQSLVSLKLSADSRPYFLGSLYRVPILERALAACRDANSSEDVREAIGNGLRDHFGEPESLCAHPNNKSGGGDSVETLTSSIIDLTTGDFLVSMGSPCVNPYHKLPWNLYEQS
jgi:isopenicillin-N N-acyltransferase like protein